VTLVISQASRWCALQVTDRLVTQGSRPFDEASNKNIIFVADDASVTMGYTGIGYLDDVTTDEWIACQLGGQGIKPGERFPSMRMGSHNNPTHIGPALRE